MKLFIFAFKCLRQLFIQRAAQDGDEGGWGGGGGQRGYISVWDDQMKLYHPFYSRFFFRNKQRRD